MGHSMNCRVLCCLAWILFALIPDAVRVVAQEPASDSDLTESDPAAAARREQELVTRARQLTFEGRRAGEGYFSADGSKMVFQSERDPANPFFQIFVMDFETGDQIRVSPGHGKTTCAWIHPDGDAVLYASTQADPEARKKQADEIALRESGKERRYSWDYDATYDLWEYDLQSRQYKQLTDVTGYDAEGSWSPDGSLVAFASNRRAYDGSMTAEEREKFAIDPAYMTDIYIMNADGSSPRRLTTTPGYDGGPFFSPDGKRICWRRFSEDGATAEIMSMKIDGSDEKQLTRLEAMSWAPYYHPSGEYLIFTTNRHGFANFELYLVDAQGSGEPVRVTWTAGFDGLPVFSPSGSQLAWTTNRTTSKQSQIFLANWNHERAREMLGLDTKVPGGARSIASSAAADSVRKARPEFSPADVARHVQFLCRPELGGRLTGTKGEQLATEYVAAYFESLGLAPAGDNGTWFQNFEFTSGVDLGANNRLEGDDSFEVKKDWQPVSFSATGHFDSAPVVFAGYGITAPGTESVEEYDSFVHLDVQDKWVMVFRFMPEDISAELRQHLSRHSSLRYKTMLARDKRARGLIVVSGPNSGVTKQLIPMRFDGSLAGSSIPVISVTDDVANRILAGSKKSLQQLQTQLDGGDLAMGFEIEGASLTADIDIRQVRRTGRNVLGRLQTGSEPAIQNVVVGAHIDHLGTGPSNSSLARDDEKAGVHFGADDNASGTAAMLEIAEYLSNQKSAGKLDGKRDVLFAAWSGEELGLIGSSHFVEDLNDSINHYLAGAHGGTASDNPHIGGTDPHAANPHAANPHAANPHTSGAHSSTGLAQFIPACLNLDMVGRMENKLVLQGVGSSSIWKGEIERRNAPVGLSITTQNDSYVPTDASVFFMQGVPILSAFTGSHSDYHTPRDTPEKLNYDGAAQIARFMGLVARSLVTREKAPDYIPQVSPEQGQRRANLRAYLGTIPDYAQSDVKGVKLSGVSKSGPAAKAGVQGGDIIIELAGKTIENIYDYTYAIEALKIGDEVEITVERDGTRVELKVTPGSRQ